MLSATALGQQFSITGKIFDETGESVAYANIVLLKVIDSTIVTGTTSDDFGAFTISEINSENYILKVSFIGFEDFLQNISIEKNTKFDSIVLKESIESLSEVEITYKKPTLKKEADRLVFNIENTALIEGDILQVIRSTPGVLIMAEQIIIKGSEPSVYINGRKVQLASDELVQLLESSTANNIKSVEVITNPSAKYDAESGVVLNIIMSKNLVTGYSGSVFTNYTQGVFPRYNTGTSHFFKNSKLNFNLNYIYTKNKINREGSESINFLDNNNNIDEIWKSIITRNTWSEMHNLNLNFDYFIDDNNTLSASSSILYRPYFKYLISNNTDIRDDNFDFLSRFNANSLSGSNKYNLGFDISYAHKFKKGQLAVNMHYTAYDFEGRQNLVSDFFDQSNVFENTSAFNTKANQDTTIFTSKIDYNLTISETSKFEAGSKYSNIKTESDITQFDVDINTGTEQIDLQNSDDFNYDENVFAAYANYSLDTDKWSISAGLRAEQTDITGISISSNSTNNQNYLKWFPNASILYNISSNFNLYTNYKRSISRPSYTDINPFRFFLYDNYVIVGNPNLTPTFLDHYVIGTTLFKKFTIEAYYQNYDGNIYDVPRQNNNTNIIEYIPVNFDKTIEIGFDFAANFNFTENWNTYFVTSFYNIEEETNFGEGFVKQDQWSNYSVFTNNFSFLKDQSLNVYIDISWLGKNLQGFKTVEDRLYSNLSISKTVFKKKGVISLNISDLFNMQDFEVSTLYLNQNNSNFINLDNRYVKLGFRYKFGNTKLSTNERINEQEELSRLKEKEY